jgi:formylglycine-generating enzyme required for sulfatase activity
MKALLITSATAILLLSAFDTKKKNKLKLPQEFVRVPAGTMLDEKEDGTYDGGKLVSINGFYMSKYEVTNLQYRQFYNDMEPGLTDEEREKIMCDSSGWTNRPFVYQEPMRTHYFSPPVYNNYPVVNIRHEGALKYCERLQQKIQKDNPDFMVEVKLPTRQEWTYAAMGGRSQAVYPWGQWHLRNKKGGYMCNFKRVQDYQIIKNRKTGLPEVHVWESSTSFFTAEVKSFYPNDYGMYNMCGNAAEMITEKGTCMGGSWDDYGGNVSTRAKATYEGSTPTVGFRPIIKVSERTK